MKSITAWFAHIATVLIAWGGPGLFLLAVLDGMGIPIPGGVDLLLIAVTAIQPDNRYWYAITAVTGSTIGTYVLYWIAYRGGEAYLHRHTLSRGGAKFRQWFQHYGLLTVFIVALVPFPLPMKVFVICAGATCTNRRAFLAVIIGARLARYTSLAILGSAMGNNAWGYLKSHMRELGEIALGLFVFLFILVKISDRLRARRALEVPPEGLV